MWTKAWEIAIKNLGPTVLVLTRQNLQINQIINRKENLLEKGAYTIINYKNYDATILASGSEVEIACSASNKLKQNKDINVRVVSIPSFELFEKNNSEYKKQILGNQTIFGIEAGVINGWEKYLDSKKFVGMTTFGESAPHKDLYKHFKVTDENLIKIIEKNL